MTNIFEILEDVRPDIEKLADEKIYLGCDFMDKYESPEIHRKREILEGTL